MKNKVAVIIPIYKNNFTENERLSLSKCKNILGNYPIVFVQPYGLETKIYSEIIPKATFQAFDTFYFKTIEGYSQLMLSPIFYKAFIAFEYILIYQTDAIVFKDQLLYWCNKGYDYIGAPWLSLPPLTKDKPTFDMRPWFVNKVGNGGFSLRKVKSHYRNTFFYRPMLKYFVKNEDMFWGVLINWFNPFFKKPNYKTAVHFAIEMDYEIALGLTNNVLPFGVHAWEKYDKEFWKEMLDLNL